MKTTPHKVLFVRIDPALYKRLQALAKAERRSVNAQVEHMLAGLLQKKGTDV
jgi:hypothetical protein